ncbi:hypothetical protein F183_A36250 [Bryobacterales bacterium F-183]|nr:hypothetical protein F183_A36250 [Bryobacterales bacterium F-183]
MSNDDHRHAVWVALADLFLDTDVRLHYVGIVRVLAASPYSIEELKRILDDEVTPALQHNLLQVAGEWAFFPEDWVIAQVSPRRGKKRWLPNFANVDEDWRILATWILRVREDPSYLTALECLVPLFLSKFSQPQTGKCARRQLAGVYEGELKPLLLPICRKLHETSPGTYPSEREIEEMWKQLPI